MQFKINYQYYKYNHEYFISLIDWALIDIIARGQTELEINDNEGISSVDAVSCYTQATPAKCWLGLSNMNVRMH